MKRILLSIGVVLAASTLNAQILTADDAVEFGTWTALDLDNDTYSWEIVDLTGAGTAIDAQAEVALSQSWDQTAGALTPDNWLISPVMDLTTYTAASMTFSAGSIEDAGSTFAAEYYSVYIVTAADAGALITALATASPVYSETIPDGGQLYTHTVDMTSFAGMNNVYVAFRHYNVTDMNALVLDDIVISGTNGIQENSFGAQVYPNPTSAELNIKTDINASNVSIIGMDGKVISTQAVNATSTTVDVSDLVAGVYFYEILAENGSVYRSTFVKK